MLSLRLVGALAFALATSLTACKLDNRVNECSTQRSVEPMACDGVSIRVCVESCPSIDSPCNHTLEKQDCPHGLACVPTSGAYKAVCAPPVTKSSCATYDVQPEAAATVAFIDANADGRVDLVTVSGTTLVVWLSTRHGLERGWSTTIAGEYSGVGWAGDVNGDHIPDLLLPTPHYAVEFVLGVGDGTFAVGSPMSTPWAYRGPGVLLAVGDIDRDGIDDVVTTCPSLDTDPYSRAAVCVSFGDRSGRLRQGPRSDVLGTPSNGAALAGDFDEDGAPDLVTTTAGGVAFIKAGADGVYRVAATFASQSWLAAAGDFDGDHHLDLALLSELGTKLTTWRGAGNGTFSPASTVDGAAVGEEYATLFVADVNGDKRADVLAFSGDYRFGGGLATYADNGGGGVGNVLLGGAGGLSTVTGIGALPAGFAPRGLGDLDGDGAADLVYAARGVGMMPRACQ